MSTWRRVRCNGILLAHNAQLVQLNFFALYSYNINYFISDNNVNITIITMN